MSLFNIVGLRWLLVVANLSLIGALGWHAYSYMFVGLDELDKTLPVASKFRVKPNVRSTAPNVALKRLMRNLTTRKPPRKFVPKEKVEIVDTKVRSGGPLADNWKVVGAMVWGDDDSIRCVTLMEKQSTRSGARRSSSSRRPGSSTRRPAANSRRPAANSRRSARAKNGYMKWLVQGESFKVDGAEYKCVAVELEPMAIVYSQGAQEYKIVQPEPVGREEYDAAGNMLSVLPEPLDRDEKKAFDENQSKLEQERFGAITMPGMKSSKQSSGKAGSKSFAKPNAKRSPRKTSQKKSTQRGDQKKALNDFIKKSSKNKNLKPDTIDKLKAASSGKKKSEQKKSENKKSGKP